MFAFVFDSVCGGEWLVLLAVILIVVGPKNLPSAARKVGEIMGKLRRAADEFKRQLMTMDEEMKKAADDIKKEYIDIPEDSSSDSVDPSDSSDDPYEYNYDDPDYTGDYHEEDYYGMDDTGSEMHSSDEEESQPSSDDQSQESVASSEVDNSSTPENPKKTMGKIREILHDPDAVNDPPRPFFEHIVALRDCLLHAAIAWVVCCVVAGVVSPQILTWLK